MDDLSGLDWSATSKAPPSKPPPVNPPSAFSALRPTPSPFSSSGRSTPLSAQGSGSTAAAPGAASKPAGQDSFSNLVNFGSAKSGANLSLREQQERLEAEKRRKQDELRRQAQINYGDGQFWDALAQRQTGSSRTASPVVPAVGATGQNGKTDSDDDLFAAFNADTKVDNASYYPPPSTSSQSLASGKASPAPALNLGNPGAWNQPTAPSASSGNLGDDDDPFGLNEMKPEAPTQRQAPVAADDGDDDLLGDLGRPVEEVKRRAQARKPEPEPGKPIEDSDSDSSDEPEARATSSDPFDRAVAQLVDYGFTPENARRGLTESGAGLNVQAVANWLLDEAHRQAKEKAQGKREGGEQRAGNRSAAGRRASPAWADETGATRGDNGSPAPGDGEIAKLAVAAGQSFLKQANSFWKTSQKKVQRAVADLQAEGGDSNQPRWMRSAPQDAMGERPGGKAAADATDEAMMLESGQRPSRRKERPAPEPQRAPSSNASSRDRSPAIPAPGGSRATPTPTPRWQSSQPSMLDARSRLSKQAVEEESSQAYVSPARRRKATPQPEPTPSPQAGPDLLFGSDVPSQSQHNLAHRPSPAPSKPATQSAPPRRTPVPRLAPRPARQIPSVPPAALQTSTRHRIEGTAYFKCGDYAAAHSSYSSSLAAMPQDHPIVILLLCNRALTALKTGEPRQAVADADSALAIIGPAKGEGESVALEDGTGEKRDMRDLYGKALTRKAEALEQMEKWADAGTVWQACVESGVGGPTAIAGRQRCQKALAPKPAPRPAPPRPAPVAAAAAKPVSTPQKSSDAVERLRAANKAAEAADDEKFALADKVDARIAAWRDGKRDNLRALLGSLDAVLWEGSGWKKVGLHELVMANKVKITYMKAIAKCHPDKLPQDASTEVRMIAGTVFATLNESWDKFKAENGL